MATGVVFSITDSPELKYEDMESLKRFIRSGYNKSYTADSMNIYYKSHYQTSTGTAAEMESLGATAIAVSQIGKAEVTLVLSGDADNASTNGKTYTLVYYDSDGDSHTAVGTGTATLNGTPVAFVPAVADFYCAYSFTASAADANVNVIAKVAAGSTYATIATTATSATQANLLGVGAIYGRALSDHADADGKLQYLCYLTPWGTKKYGHCTHGSTSTDEIRFFEATDDGDQTTTATATTVKDFYRVVWHTTNSAPTANSTEWFISDADSDGDGGEGDIYSVIPQGSTSSINTRCHCRQGYDSWLGKVKFKVQPLVDADDYYIAYINCTPKDSASAVEQNIPIIIDKFTETVWEFPFPLKEETDVYFTFLDADVAAIVQIELWFLEVDQA